MTAEDLGTMLDRYYDAHALAYQAMQDLRDACRDEIEAAAISEMEDERLRLQVGPMLVFFRVAYEADGSAHLEYGHYEHADDGTLLELADGDWAVDEELRETLEGPEAEDRIYVALEEVRRSVAESADDRRIVDGIVDGIYSPKRQTREYRR